MIINISRAVQFQECRVKEYNWNERKLQSVREADSLMIGSAFHKGVANYFANNDANLAAKAAEEEFRTKLPTDLLPEERTLAEQQIELSKRMVTKYADFYHRERFTVLQPEVEFFVPLPDTTHHCWFAHRILKPDVPFHSCAPTEQCYQPIFFTGKTDAVVNMDGMVWLLEHKTSAMTGQIFFDKYLLDMQPTGYLYGIWKAIGIRPSGFILNVVKKPRRNASDPFHIEFEREPFLRTEADLLRFERELTAIAQDLEDSRITGRRYMNTRSCLNFNRKCFYLGLCSKHGETNDGEFAQRPPDYVELHYYKLLGLTPPQQLTQIETQETIVE